MITNLKSILRFCLVIVVFMSCTANCTVSKGTLLIPVGRLSKPGNEVEVKIDKKLYTNAVLINDENGGQWLQIPNRDLVRKNILSLRIIKKKTSTDFLERNVDTNRWILPVHLINSDDQRIIAEAQELTKGLNSNDAKAEAILRYVVHNVTFKVYPGMHYDSASTTLVKGYGICVNHSRLFIALCRAVGIPARSISGAVLGEDHKYYHHEWVEFYNEQGVWHSLDPTISDNFNYDDPKRIDLVYDIESNSIYPFDKGWEKTMVIGSDRNISVFCTDWSAQRKDGEMSYLLLDDSDSNGVIASVDYQINRYFR